MVCCCIPYCISVKPPKPKNVSFHRFPRDPILCRKWKIPILRLYKKLGLCWWPNPQARVCSLHFLESDYSISTTLRTLLPNRVPSVFSSSVNKQMIPFKRRTDDLPFKNNKLVKVTTEHEKQNKKFCVEGNSVMITLEFVSYINPGIQTKSQVTVEQIKMESLGCYDSGTKVHIDELNQIDVKEEIIPADIQSQVKIDPVKIEPEKYDDVCHILVKKEDPLYQLTLVEDSKDKLEKVQIEKTYIQEDKISNVSVPIEKINPVDSSQKEPYTCHICYEPYIEESTVPRYMIVHKGVKPLVCNKCCEELFYDCSHLLTNENA